MLLQYVVSFVDTDQWASLTHHMKGHSRHNSSLIGRRKHQAKFGNDCVSRNGHRIKITQPNSMILVSFYSAEDALFKDEKKISHFSILKIRLFFWGGGGGGDTRYREFGWMIRCVHTLRDLTQKLIVYSKRHEHDDVTTKR